MKTGYGALAGIWLALTLAFSPQAVAARDRAGEFDFYQLTLSWSPTFCLTHGDNPQCTKGYGFVLHGLWPQYANGGWPESCQPAAPLSAEARRYGNQLFPTNGLLSHEWQKHGTCSGLSDKDYLAAADKALTSVKIPAAFDAPAQPLRMSAQQIAAQFRQANPGLPADGIAVVCHGPELSEVRVCLSKDLGFQSCGRAIKSRCRGGDVRIPNVR